MKDLALLLQKLAPRDKPWLPITVVVVDQDYVTPMESVWLGVRFHSILVWFYYKSLRFICPAIKDKFIRSFPFESF